MDYSLPPKSQRPYRPNVGILLLNVYRLVLIGERIDLPGAWQMPQGGINQGETVTQAFMREIKEEMGIAEDKVQIIRQASQVLRYDFPPHVLQRQPQSPYRGQEQHWVAGRFLGCNDDICVETCEPEFRDWRWVTPQQLQHLVVPFKRETYMRILREFSAFFEDSSLPWT